MSDFALTADLEELVRRLRLTVDRLMDENESFVILKCRDRSGAHLVLKYVRTSSLDAFRRIRNEALLTKHFPAVAPLQLLAYRDHGNDYLLTEYDSGTLLRAHTIRDPSVLKAVADALIRFQDADLDVRSLGLRDREGVATYYMKVMAKHLLHLLPSHMTLREAVTCLCILSRGLPMILKRRVICHGDLLPTNLLYDPRARRVTFTDLEGFMSINHPLFDVVTLFTVDDGDISAWRWQPWFLNYYLENSAERFRLETNSEEFRRVYRAILVFFLAYRLTETRNHLLGTTFFDGLGKLAYLRRRLLGLPREFLLRRRNSELKDRLETRRRNLRRMLSTPAYLEHLEAMLSVKSRPSEFDAGSSPSVGDESVPGESPPRVL